MKLVVTMGLRSQPLAVLMSYFTFNLMQCVCGLLYHNRMLEFEGGSNI